MSVLLADLRRDDLRRKAEFERLVSLAARHRERVGWHARVQAVRERVGYHLVEVGLRLAVCRRP